MGRTREQLNPARPPAPVSPGSHITLAIRKQETPVTRAPARCQNPAKHPLTRLRSFRDEWTRCDSCYSYIDWRVQCHSSLSCWTLLAVRGEDLEPHVEAGLGPLVVLFGEHGALASGQGLWLEYCRGCSDGVLLILRLRARRASLGVLPSASRRK